MRFRTTQGWWRCGLLLAALGAGCSVALAPLEQPDGAPGGSAGTGGIVTGGAGGIDASSGGSGGLPPNPIPTSCAEAVTAKSSFGCEFWPTVTPNIVWSIFDFAVIVTNPQSASVDVSVKQGATFSVTEQIPAASAKIIYLPWVSSLKGADTDSCGSNANGGPTVRADDGAYVLTSSLPVGVTQHSPVEATALGGPSGKSWASCPGYKCTQSNLGCFAASTDSSLLLPTTSLGTSYRIVGAPGWVEAGIGANATVTATADNTQLSVVLSLTATLLAGGGLAAEDEGSTFQVTLNEADVLVLAAGSKSDLSGTLVSADKPIQIVTGIACTDIPAGKSACDHLEEALPPATALGKKYVVVAPLGPKPSTSVHRVRLVGHVDGTELSYPGGAPANAPASLSAGQLADLGLVTKDFVVEANEPFAVMSFIPGSEVLNGGTAENQLGDPALRLVLPVSQYRTAYSVAAAPSYASSYFELIVPDGASVKLDGGPVSGSPKAIGTSGFSVWLVPVSASTATSHSLTSDVPFGVQVVGFDRYTAYAHAGGMNVGATP